MDSALDLQDDIDKLDEILDDSDPEDFSRNCELDSVDNKCELGGESEKHHMLKAASPSMLISKLPTLSQGLHQNGKSDIHPEGYELGENSEASQPQNISEDEKDEFILGVSDGELLKTRKSPSSTSHTEQLITDEDDPLEVQPAYPQPPSPAAVKPSLPQTPSPPPLSLQSLSPPTAQPTASSLPRALPPTNAPSLPPVPPRTAPSPPFPDADLLTTSQGNHGGSSAPPPSDDMVLEVDDLLQEPCAPDFDPPDAVIDVDDGKAYRNDSVVSVAQDIGTVEWTGAPRSLGLDSDTCGLSEVLGNENIDGEEESMVQWEEDTSSATSIAQAESSGLQGDINKLSRVLSGASVVPPVPLDPVDRPAAEPSPSLRRRGASSTRRSYVASGHPSEASMSGVELPSTFGDEVLSQDDFLDDTFIGQDIPVNLENCLALNSAYQEVIDENLADLEQLLRNNRAQQAELTALLNSKQEPKEFQRAPQGRLARWNWHMFLNQHFSDAQGFGPMPNADDRTKAMRAEFEDQRWSRPWLQSERETLFEAVLADARRRHERTARHRVTALRNAIQRLEGSSKAERTEVPLTSLREKLEKANELLAEAQDVSVLDIITEMDDEYDWPYISLTVMDGQRTASECRLQWCNFVRPTISHADWTPEEDSVVRTYATKKTYPKPTRWQAAADKLGRTAFQVFQRWQLELSAPERRYWTHKESEELLRVVQDVRVGNYINWSHVAIRLPGRTASQCGNRYARLKLERKRGRFTKEEDMRILAAVEEVGVRDFHAVCAFVPDRTARQLQKRYNIYLKPLLSWSEWTREEDEQLVRFVCEHGPAWTRASGEIGNGRTAAMCRTRFYRIEKVFQYRGGVPVTGSLGGESKRYNTDYFSQLREQLGHELDSLKSAGGEGAVGDRKQAALEFLKRPMTKPKPLAQKKNYGVLWNRRRTEAQKMRKNTAPKWNSIHDMLFLETTTPHRRVPAPTLDAEAAAATSRAWCLPPPTPARLEECAAAGPPVTEFDGAALSAWRQALLPNAPESSLRQAVLAVAHREYNWRRMPLLPASFASCSAFRGLLLERPRLEQGAVEKTGSKSARISKLDEFNETMAEWAKQAMSGSDGGGEDDGPWLMSANKTHHHDHMVRVRITEQPRGGPSRQFYLTVAAAEANDPDELAKRILRQVPDLVKMDICRPRKAGPGERPPPPPPGPPPPASADDAWNLLLARFVSAFFWPALMSVQPPPDVTDLGGSDLEDPDDLETGPVDVAEALGIRRREQLPVERLSEQASNAERYEPKPKRRKKNPE